MAKITSINIEVFKKLKTLADKGTLHWAKKSGHPKLVGLYAGQKRIFTLASSTSNWAYEKNIKTRLKRFINTLQIGTI